MARLEFDKVGEHYFEAGVSEGVVYVGTPAASTGDNKVTGVAWNGLTSVSNSPDGGDANDQWADNVKYLALRGNVNIGGTIEALTYPTEFEPCLGNGKVSSTNGGYFTQQKVLPFSFSYVTKYGNEQDGLDYSEKLHIVWNATCNPVEKTYETINDSPEGQTFSFEFTTIPLSISKKAADGSSFKPASYFEITKTSENATIYQALKDALQGSDGTSGKTATLLMPDEVIAIVNPA